jgi:hypothetical protein
MDGNSVAGVVVLDDCLRRGDGIQQAGRLERCWGINGGNRVGVEGREQRVAMVVVL